MKTTMPVLAAVAVAMLSTTDAALAAAPEGMTESKTPGCYKKKMSVKAEGGIPMTIVYCFNGAVYKREPEDDPRNWNFRDAAWFGSSHTSNVDGNNWVVLRPGGVEGMPFPHWIAQWENRGCVTREYQRYNWGAYIVWLRKRAVVIYAAYCPPE